jgi:hypothetical protein
VLRVKTFISVLYQQFQQDRSTLDLPDHLIHLPLVFILCSYIYFAFAVAAFAGERLILSLFALFPSITSSISSPLVSLASLQSRHPCVALIVRVRSRFASHMPLEKW